MEKISRKDLTLAWLAGLIDGDGCISIARMVNNRRTKQTYHLQVYTTITTTCTLTMEHLRKVYTTFDIPYHISLRDNGKEHKPVYIVRVHGMKRSKRLIPLIMPYLITKHREAELVMEFIEIRERLFAQKTHDPREDVIAEELSAIKGNRNMVKNPQRLYARLY